MCRKFHGAAYATIAGVSRAHFRWTEGEEALTGYRAENGTVRTFCRHCGSSLSFSSPRASAEIIEIALGALDGDIPVEPNAHILSVPVRTGQSSAMIYRSMRKVVTAPGRNDSVARGNEMARGRRLLRIPTAVGSPPGMASVWMMLLGYSAGSLSRARFP